MLNIHKNINEKLEYFHRIKKVPHIIFNGPSGSGKSTIVYNFISLIYNGNRDKIKDFVMFVNCAHGKGIKFIREELKFFAKTHINSHGGDVFKSIVLFNGDKLTTDAQSALRRCIELFSHSTRFFIIVEDKYKLLKPILSRFCEIYVPLPIINGETINLYQYNLKNTFDIDQQQTNDWLKKTVNAINVQKDIQALVVKLYEKAYSSLDLIRMIEQDSTIEDEKRYELLVAFSKAKKEIRNEKILMYIILHFVFIDKNYCLDNLSFL
jgi:DNA polymerase III delta prime subunit